MANLEKRYGLIEVPVYDGSFSTVDAMYDVFPQLQRYFDARNYSRVDIVKLIKYIWFMYDPNTNLINEFPNDLDKRKEAAAVDAGYEQINGKWPQLVLDIFSMADEEATDLILQFLQSRKNLVWNEWMISENEFHQINKQRLTNIENMDLMAIKRRAELGSFVKDIAERIEDLKDKFFGDDGVLREKQEILTMVTPENVFKVLNIPDKDYKLNQVNDVLPGTRIRKGNSAGV